jgi:hypothetical protein
MWYSCNIHKYGKFNWIITNSKILATLNKVIIWCTVHYIVHLQCTFSRIYEGKGSDVLAWVREQRKMSQVLGVFGLLDFTMLWPVLAWCAVWNLWTAYFFKFPIFFFFWFVVDHGYWISGYRGTTVFFFKVHNMNNIPEWYPACRLQN